MVLTISMSVYPSVLRGFFLHNVIIFISVPNIVRYNEHDYAFQ